MKSNDARVIEEADRVLRDYFNKKKSKSTNLISFDEVDSPKIRKFTYELEYLKTFQDKQFKIGYELENRLEALNLKRSNLDVENSEERNDSQDSSRLMDYFVSSGRFNYYDKYGNAFAFGQMRKSRAFDSNEHNGRTNGRYRRNSGENNGYDRSGESNGYDKSIENNGYDRSRENNGYDRSSENNGYDRSSERHEIKNSVENTNGVFERQGRSNERVSFKKENSDKITYDLNGNEKSPDYNRKISSPIDSNKKEFTFNEKDLINFDVDENKNFTSSNTYSIDNSKNSTDSNIDEIEGKFKKGICYNSTIRGSIPCSVRASINGINEIGRSFDVRDLIKLK